MNINKKNVVNKIVDEIEKCEDVKQSIKEIVVNDTFKELGNISLGLFQHYKELLDKKCLELENMWKDLGAIKFTVVIPDVYVRISMDELKTILEHCKGQHFVLLNRLKEVKKYKKEVENILQVANSSIKNRLLVTEIQRLNNEKTTLIQIRENVPLEQHLSINKTLSILTSTIKEKEKILNKGEKHVK